MERSLSKPGRFQITKLEDRIAPAVAVGGLAAVAIDDVVEVRNNNIPITVDVNVSNIRVNVAALGSAAGSLG